MNDMKHTPGPWTIEGEGTLVTPVTGALIGTTRIGTGGYGEIELLDGTNEPEGNKYLIAAAPELLAALRALLVVADHPNNPMATGACSSIIADARNAIAKAKGGTSC